MPQHLDAEELFHLALAAGMEGAHDRAITLLKQAWALDPRNPQILYCLGAEHAQIGMYERAMGEMERALEMEPGMDTARLQLGLLCLTCGYGERGEAVLQPLLGRDEADALGHFARGLVALLHDDLAGCRRAIERGIELNQVNMPLNADMARLLEAAVAGAAANESPVAAAPVAAQAANAAEAAPAEGNLWLSSYKKAGGGR